jgi:thiol-disulfide isomerase/thioredoxin
MFSLLLPVTVVAGEIQPYTADTDAQLSLPDLSDQEHSLSEYRGKVVLVNFWASWCQPCIYEMPALVRLQKRLAEQPFEILALNVGEKKYRVMKFVKLINFKLPVLLDPSSDTFNTWGVKILPTSFLIGPDGRIRYKILGDPDWADEGTLGILEKLLAETAPDRRGEPEITNTTTNTNDK